MTEFYTLQLHPPGRPIRGVQRGAVTRVGACHACARETPPCKKLQNLWRSQAQAQRTRVRTREALS